MSSRGGRLAARISSMRDVGGAVREIVLEPIDRGLPGFEAGAHIDVRLEADLVRQYSLLNDPDDRGRYGIAVKRDPDGRGESVEAQDTLRVGQRLEIGEPRNHFPLDRDPREVVLVAGGIGLTPMLAMSHTLLRDGLPFTLHVCARSRAALPYGDELGELPFASRVVVHLDDGSDEQRLGDGDLGAWAPGRCLYLCGPGGFLAAVIDRARRLGWPDDAIRTEAFSPPVA